MITCKTKPWGNSLGIIIPKGLVKDLNIKPDEEILIEIEKKKSILKELFGSMKFKMPVDKIIKESRKSLESK